MSRALQSVLPILSVVAAIMLMWVVAVVPMNIHLTADQAQRDGIAVTPDTPIARRDLSGVSLALQNLHLVPLTYVHTRPNLPSPHQVGAELYDSVIDKKITSKRSLVYHGWVTLAPTLLGFAIGTGLGIMLAVGIVYSRVMDKSVMPWAIVSQTIPIIALAPMIIVVLYSIGVQGILPKAIISAYLSFFPVVVGMVKGLRSPDAMQLDLLKTYSANTSQGFWKLRLPSSMPYLFTSLKIGIAASLLGAIVGELPTGAVAGLGARLLAGSYYGQTVQIWSALFAAAILAGLLVALLEVIEKNVLKRMGMAS